MAKHPAWQQGADESTKAYAAFCAYYQLPANERSIEAAWSKSAGKDQGKRGQKVPRHWYTWSAGFNWVKRAAAHDKHLAELDRLKWVERRKQMREAEWDDAEQVRRLVMDALPEASRFIQRKEVFTKGKDGAPDTLVITESFNLVGLMQTRAGADKLQRLATDQPTEHIQLTGAALDAYIASQLTRLQSLPNEEEGGEHFFADEDSGGDQ